MTPDELKGIEVYVDELAAMAIKNRARAQVSSAIAEKVLEKYREPFIKEVAGSITLEEVRQRVIEKITDEIVEEWRKNG